MLLWDEIDDFRSLLEQGILAKSQKKYSSRLTAPPVVNLQGTTVNWPEGKPTYESVGVLNKISGDSVNQWDVESERRERIK